MIESAREYHRHTSYDPQRMPRGGLDWSSQPDVYKHYPAGEPIQLPRDVGWPETGFFEVLEGKSVGQQPAEPAFEDLSRLLGVGYGFTARVRRPDGDVYFRSVPSAGALYPCELYLVVRGVGCLEDGVYHYVVDRHALLPLRTRSDLEKAAGSAGETSGWSITFFVSAIFFRSSWKYRDRAYRYHLLDGGHLAENVALACRGLGLETSIFYDFDDAAVNRLLGLDEHREVCVAALSAGPGEPVTAPAADALPEYPETFREASRASLQEKDYPPIREIHDASRRVPEAAGAEPDVTAALGVTLESPQEVGAPGASPVRCSFVEAVLKRRSRRNFVREPVTEDQWRGLIAALREGLPAQGAALREREQSVAVGMLAAKAEGLEPGFYLLDRFEGRLGRVAEGRLTGPMAAVCLHQEWLGHAALHFCFLTNLEKLERAWGPRAYRYAMLTAGRLCHRLYLAAEAMDLGGCGIGAFYDGEASRLLGLSEESNMLYLMGIGPIKMRA